MDVTAQQDDALTRVGPGTPCGELMRRYWQPAGLSEEIPAGGAPIPVRLLGEDLVLFRDNTGRPGLLGLHCAHRGADLSYGRIEDGGLRCIYHGWLYDVSGRCLEQPGEPLRAAAVERTNESPAEVLSPARGTAARIRHVAYPCQEAGGVVFTYMGPGEPPLLPAYEALTLPEQHRQADKFWLDCSYLQGLEGSIDPTHLSFLHTNLGGGSPSNTYFLQDRAPTIEVEETDFGLRIMAARDAEPGETYLRVSNFMLPMMASIPTGPMRQEGYTINFHVPIDDTHHWNYMLEFNRDHPMPDRIMDTREMAEGYRIVQNRGNRYLQDRSSMAHSYSGMGRSFSAQDACVTEGPGPIQDRTEEHPGYSDKAILAARVLLTRALQEAQAGRDPVHVLREADANQFPHLVVVNDVVPNTEWRVRWKDSLQKTPSFS